VIPGIIVEESDTQFRSVDGTLRQMTDMSLSIIAKGSREFTGKIWSKDGVRASLESGPPISVVRNMDMEERSRSDPPDQPRQKQQTPR
jgi:hypothetical protein